MNIIAARRYVSLRSRALTADEAETRRIAYALKYVGCAEETIQIAAREMARLIDGPCWLIPIPNSRCDTSANEWLARAIAAEVPGARVIRSIIRERPVESQTERHRKELGPIPPHAHHFRRVGKMLRALPTYFVDNVTTSGNTFQAAYEAMHFGTGLAFADAYHTPH